MTPTTGVNVEVVAVIGGPTLGVIEHPLKLDAPLSWAAWQAAEAQGLPPAPLTPTYAHDFPLPLARWEQGDTWGWCTSRASIDVIANIGVQIRRRPPIGAMARYGKERKHHAALGPTKARNSVLSAILVDTITWQVCATDQAELTHLLQHVTHLGARHRNGFGAVQEWIIRPGTPDGWQDRPMPAPDGTPQGVRAPYWHPSRRHPCSQ